EAVFRRVAEAAVGAERQRAVGRPLHQRRGQRIAVDIAVVAKHALRRDRQGAVVIDLIAVGDRYGGVVHRRDREGDGRRMRGGAMAVERLVGEAVLAVVVGVGGVGECAVRVERQRSMGGPLDEFGGERPVVLVGGAAQRVAVVGEDGATFAAVDDERAILGEAVAVAGRDRGIVHRGDRNRDRGGLGSGAQAVDRFVGEAVAAVVVGIRRVGEGAVRVQRERAVRRALDQRGRERAVVLAGGTVVEVAVVGQQAGFLDHELAVLGDAVAAV